MKKLLEKDGVEGYIVFNKEGIPMRFAGKGITHTKAVHYAALVTDYWQIVQKTLNNSLQKVFKYSDEEREEKIEYIRLRTKKKTELIFIEKDGFFIVCIQSFVKKEDLDEEDKENQGSEMGEDEY